MFNRPLLIVGAGVVLGLLAFGLGARADSCSADKYDVLHQADLNNNGSLEDSEFFSVIDQWVDKQVEDPDFFAAIDAWTSGCTISGGGSGTPAPPGPKLERGLKPAQDLNNDGIYEDVDGNSRFEANDCGVLTLSVHTEIKETDRRFDFNKDGQANFGDAVACNDILESGGSGTVSGQGLDGTLDQTGQSVPSLAGRYQVQTFPVFLAREANKTTTLNIDRDGELDLGLRADGDLCPGQASAKAEVSRQGSIIKTVEVKDSEPDNVLFHVVKFDSVAVKQGDVLKLTGTGHTQLLGACAEEAVIEAKLKYLANPNQASIYLGANQQKYQLEINEGPDDLVQSCLLEVYDRATDKLVMAKPESPQAATHLPLPDIVPSIPGVYPVSYTCKLKNGDSISTKTEFRVSGTPAGPQPSTAPEKMGEVCETSLQCDLAFDCLPVAPSFTAYPKACCPVGKQWNGKECSSAKSSPGPVEPPLTISPPSSPTPPPPEELICRTARECALLGFNFYLNYDKPFITMKVYPSQSRFIQITSDPGLSLFPEVYITNQLTKNQKTIRLEFTEFHDLDSGSPSFSYYTRLTEEILGFSGDNYLDLKVPVIENGVTKIIRTVDNFANFYLDYSPPTEKGYEFMRFEGKPCDNNCLSPLNCNPTAPGFNEYTEACCPGGKRWNGKSCINVSKSPGPYAELSVQPFSADPSTIKLLINQDLKGMAQECRIYWSIEDYTGFRNWEKTTITAGQHTYNHTYVSRGYQKIYYECFASNPIATKTIISKYVSFFTDSIPKDSQSPIADTFDLVFVPLNYSSYDINEFRNLADAAFNRFLRDSPFRELAQPLRKVKSHLLENNPAFQCRSLTDDCLAQVVKFGQSAQYKGTADLVMGICKNCFEVAAGAAEAIASKFSVTDQLFGAEAVLHEFGHNLGLYHLNSPDPNCGIAAGACQWPNGADCGSPDVSKFYMTYCPFKQRYGPAGYKYMREVLKNFMCEDPNFCNAPFTR